MRGEAEHSRAREALEFSKDTEATIGALKDRICGVGVTRAEHLYEGSDEEHAVNFLAEIDTSAKLEVLAALESRLGYVDKMSQAAATVLYLAKCQEYVGLDPRARYTGAFRPFILGEDMSKILKSLNIAHEGKPGDNWSFSLERLHIVRSLLRRKLNLPSEIGLLTDDQLLQIREIQTICADEVRRDLEILKRKEIVRMSLKFLMPVLAGVVVAGGVGVVVSAVNRVVSKLESNISAEEMEGIIYLAATALLMGISALVIIRWLCKGESGVANPRSVLRKKRRFGTAPEAIDDSAKDLVPDATDEVEGDELITEANQSEKITALATKKRESVEVPLYKTLAEQWQDQIQKIPDEFSVYESAFLMKNYKPPERIIRHTESVRRLNDEEFARADRISRAQVAFKSAQKACSEFKPNGILLVEKSDAESIGGDLEYGHNLGLVVKNIVERTVANALQKLSENEAWSRDQARALAVYLGTYFECSDLEIKDMQAGLELGEKSFTELESELNPPTEVGIETPVDDYLYW